MGEHWIWGVCFIFATIRILTP